MSTASRYEDGKEEIEQYGPEHKVEKVPVTCILKYTNKVCCFFPDTFQERKYIITP